MTEQLSCKTGSIYVFSPNNKPIKKIDAGSQIEIETYDCFTNQITTSATPFNAIDWNQINPATGPIYVKGAEPGDILKVKIEKIEVANQGIMATGPGLGVLGDLHQEFTTKIIPIENGKAVFDNEIHIPLNPMVGVIGVAPAEGEVPCGTPGPHGGNMDNKRITTGAILYFPIAVKGALFALGDLHAAMGDGEIGVSGVEIPGKVTVTLDVIKGNSIKHPFIEGEDYIGSIFSAETLDEAVKGSVEQLAALIKSKTGQTIEEISMLFSVVGQTEICQVVDPLKTARFILPKWVLERKGITLF